MNRVLEETCKASPGSHYRNGLVLMDDYERDRRGFMSNARLFNEIINCSLVLAFMKYTSAVCSPHMSLMKT